MQGCDPIKPRKIDFLPVARKRKETPIVAGGSFDKEYNFGMSLSDTQRIELYSSAASVYRANDKNNWRFAALAACSGGTYRDLAAYIGGVSEDKVANAAHAWLMYRDLWRAYGGAVTLIRRLDYVYLSHFFALHRVRQRYGVGLDVLWGYLQAIYQGEGSISSRDIDMQADREFGKEKALPYEAKRAQKALRALLSRGDLSQADRRVFQAAFDTAMELSR